MSIYVFQTFAKDTMWNRYGRVFVVNYLRYSKIWIQNNHCNKQGEKAVFGTSKEGKKKVGLRWMFNEKLTKNRSFYTLAMVARNEVKTTKELSGIICNY
ncbi:hypothetical protein CEQ22_008330 [Parabacteroides distasonis]|jgi:hypothetical protein|nr:hypothetical protein CEQ22_008330 [Parabacteroides distasonis]